MSYVEKNLGVNEELVKKADKNGLFLIGVWVKGILLCWLLLIPLIKAIVRTIQFSKIELAITNKRVIGKVGVLNTSALDSPLNKIQNVSETQTFGGKIFNYSTIVITTAAGSYKYDCIKKGAEFKNAVMAQIEQYEEDRIKQQAAEMANAMASAMNNNK